MSDAAFDMNALAAAIAERLHELQGDPMLTGPQAAKHLGVSMSTFHRMRATPGFPAPRRPNGGHPRWQRSVLDAWERDKDMQ